MMSRVPLRDGRRVLARAPESILAEIAWRWTFAAAFWGLLILSFHQYFSQVQISNAEYALLKSFEPYTWIGISIRMFQAFLQGLRDMGPILVPALVLFWIMLATIGRAVTVRSLASGPVQTNWLSLAGLNFYRVLMAFSAFAAYVGAAILISVTLDPQRYFAVNVLLLLAVVLFLLLVWSVVNWFVSLAQIFAAKDGAPTVAAIKSAVDLYQRHASHFYSMGFWFSFCRTILAIAVTVLVTLPLGTLFAIGVGPTVAYIATITLLYFAFADALYVWRMCTYIGLTEPETVESVDARLPAPPPLPQPGSAPDPLEQIVKKPEIEPDASPPNPKQQIAQN